MILMGDGRLEQGLEQGDWSLSFANDIQTSLVIHSFLFACFSKCSNSYLAATHILQLETDAMLAEIKDVLGSSSQLPISYIRCSSIYLLVVTTKELLDDIWLTFQGFVKLFLRRLFGELSVLNETSILQSHRLRVGQ